MEGENRIILINGDKSKWYEKAIFIVRDNVDKKHIPVNLVMEAERIIDNYLHNWGRKESKPAGPQEIFIPPTEARSEVKPTTETVPKLQSNSPKRIAKKRVLDFALNMIMMFCCVALAGLLVYAFWG